jgi:ssDNA-binding Zn-finger/Zn-ribbon topoisomerase 1
MSKRNKAERDGIPIRAGRLTKRKPKPRKRKHRRPRDRGRDTVSVACSRCAYGIEMKRGEFGRESRGADGCRCPLCGGNVVLAKYAEVGGNAILANVRLTFGKWKGSRLGDAPRSYLEDLVHLNPESKQFREFQNTVRQFLALGSNPKPS